MNEENEVMDNDEYIEEIESDGHEEVEAEARSQGWVSEEDFKGPKDKWVDAATFVQRGHEINPILRKNNEKLMKELKERDKVINELKVGVDEFKAYHAETANREYEKALKALRTEKKEALEMGEHDRVMEIDDKLDELKTKKPIEKEEVKQELPQPDPAFVEWYKDNKWLTEDVELWHVAQGISKILTAENPGMDATDFLNEIKRRVQRRYPDKFGKTKVRSVVEGGGNIRPNSGTKKSYNDLPDEAKKACDKFVNQGWLTKEQYISDYFSE